MRNCPVFVQPQIKALYNGTLSYHYAAHIHNHGTSKSNKLSSFTQYTLLAFTQYALLAFILNAVYTVVAFKLHAVGYELV